MRCFFFGNCWMWPAIGHPTIQTKLCRSFGVTIRSLNHKFDEILHTCGCLPNNPIPIIWCIKHSPLGVPNMCKSHTTLITSERVESYGSKHDYGEIPKLIRYGLRTLHSAENSARRSRSSASRCSRASCLRKMKDFTMKNGDFTMKDVDFNPKNGNWTILGDVNYETWIFDNLKMGISLDLTTKKYTGEINKMFVIGKIGW